jgi:hypothetical protein
MTAVERALANAVRTGAPVRFEVQLDHDELNQRRLWLRPEVEGLLRPGRLTANQIETVRAAFRRFVVGGKYMVITAESPHKEVQSLGDIRELKGPAPAFIEIRFRPPPHDLRLFGRFVGHDSLVLTTSGVKAHNSKTGTKRLSVGVNDATPSLWPPACSSALYQQTSERAFQTRVSTDGPLKEKVPSKARQSSTPSNVSGATARGCGTIY